MFERLHVMLMKEFLELRRDRMALLVLFIPLLIQTIVFAYAATFTVNHMSTVVLDLDRSQASRSLISNFVATGRFDIVDVADRQQQITRDLDSGRATLAIVREREMGTLEQIMVSPIRPVEFILGKTAPFFLIGLADVAIVTALGILWFGVPFLGNPLVMLLGASLFLLAALGLGLLLSTFSRTQQQAFALNFFWSTRSLSCRGLPFLSRRCRRSCSGLRSSIRCAISLSSSARFSSKALGSRCCGQSLSLWAYLPRRCWRLASCGFASHSTDLDLLLLSRATGAA